MSRNIYYSLYMAFSEWNGFFIYMFCQSNYSGSGGKSLPGKIKFLIDFSFNFQILDSKLNTAIETIFRYLVLQVVCGREILALSSNRVSF